MSNSLLIHPGLPRTATTTLQKNIFPNYCAHKLFTKDAKSSTFKTNERQSVYKAITTGESVSSTKIARAIFTLASKQDGESLLLLQKAVERILRDCEDDDYPALISSEFLTLTFASFSQKNHLDKRPFGVFPLIKAINEVSNQAPKVIIVFRDPIEQFTSMFIRLVEDRRTNNLEKYINYQLAKEKSCAFSSTIAHMYHKKLIQQLEASGAEVLPIRYKALLQTPNAPQLLGLQGKKVSLKKQKKENHHLAKDYLGISKQQIFSARLNCKKAFKQLGIYEQIYNDSIN